MKQQYFPGQFVLRIRDNSVKQIKEYDDFDDTYLLDDDLWVTPRQIEDPMQSYRTRSLERKL